MDEWIDKWITESLKLRNGKLAKTNLTQPKDIIYTNISREA